MPSAGGGEVGTDAKRGVPRGAVCQGCPEARVSLGGPEASVPSLWTSLWEATTGPGLFLEQCGRLQHGVRFAFPCGLPWVLSVTFLQLIWGEESLWDPRIPFLGP